MGVAILGALLVGSIAPISPSESLVDTGRLFDKATQIMEDNYVDPDRLNWTDMLTHGLGRIENAIPEVFIKKSDPTKLLIQVGQAQKNFSLPKTAGRDAGGPGWSQTQRQDCQH